MYPPVTMIVESSMHATAKWFSSFVFFRDDSFSIFGLVVFSKFVILVTITGAAQENKRKALPACTPELLQKSRDVILI